MTVNMNKEKVEAVMERGAESGVSSDRTAHSMTQPRTEVRLESATRGEESNNITLNQVGDTAKTTAEK